MNNLMVAQSGGPTCAINATLYGVIKRAIKEKDIDFVYGAKFGLKGIFADDILCLNKFIENKNIKLLLQTPAAALGSCRYKLKDAKDSTEEYEKIIDLFRKYNIRYFLYIGGNDSMDTVKKLSLYLKQKNIKDIFVVGVPKTIDNDLEKTDHTPGFGSAAKYIATTFSELERDGATYNEKAVTLVETMGRDAGWLVAASALSRLNGFCGPDLIYFCEKVFDFDKFLQDVEIKLKQKPNVLVAVSEGVKDKYGRYISETAMSGKRDAFGHTQNSGAAMVLKSLLKKNIDCKTRAIELNTPQRAAAHLASKTDIAEAIMVGEKAVEFALCGNNFFMVNILRKSDDIYKAEYGFVDVDIVANKIKKVPDDFIDENGVDVTKKAIHYLKPLIAGNIDFIYENDILAFIKFI